MFKISTVFLSTVLGSNEKLRDMFASDRKGRFNIEEAAAELNLNEEYTAALFRPLSSTFFVRGEVYPSQKSRSSRPGSSRNYGDGNTLMYKRNLKLDRELLRLDRKRITTE